MKFLQLESNFSLVDLALLLALLALLLQLELHLSLANLSLVDLPLLSHFPPHDFLDFLFHLSKLNIRNKEF